MRVFFMSVAMVAIAFHAWTAQGAEELVVISRNADVYASQRSGSITPRIEADIPSLSWTTAPVTDQGGVAFMSREGNIFHGLQESGGPEFGDWDAFFAPAESAPVELSLARGAPFDFDGANGSIDQVGECRELVFHRGLLMEIRDPEGHDPLDGMPAQQHVFWRNRGDAYASSVPLPEGMVVRFLNVAGTDTEAWLVFSARTAEGTYRLYRQAFARASEDESWERSGALDPILPETQEHCLHPSISADGRSVAFVTSEALSDEDSGKNSDAYLWTESGTTTLLTGDFSGAVHETCLVPGCGDLAYITLTMDGRKQVVAVHAETRAATVISDGDGLPEDAEAWFPRCSDDGRFVVFIAENTEADSVPRQVYLYDRAAGRVIRRLSETANGDPASVGCDGPDISRNGRYVTFSTTATNLTGDSAGTQHVLRVDCGESFANTAAIAQTLQAVGKVGETKALPLPAWDREGDPLEVRISQRPGKGRLEDDPGDGWHDPDTVFPLHFTGETVGGSELLVEVREAVPGSDAMVPATTSIAILVLDADRRVTDPILDAPGGSSEGADLQGRDVPAHRRDRFAMDASGRWVAYTVLDVGEDGLNHRALQLVDTATQTSWRMAMADESGARPDTTIPVALAPDGSALAYCVNGRLVHCPIRNGAPQRAFERSLSVSGGEQVNLADGGETVIFDRTTGAYADVKMWDLRSCRVTTLASAVLGYPVISDSGDVAAWITADGQSVEVAYLNAQDDGEHVQDRPSFGPYGGGVDYLSLSGNGRFLAFEAGETVRVIDGVDTENTQTLNGYDSPSLSRGGGHLFVRRIQNEQAYRYSLKDQTFELLSRPVDSEQPSSESTHSGLLTADGQSAVFVGDPALFDGDTSAEHKLVRVDLLLPEGGAYPQPESLEFEVDEDFELPLQLRASDPDANDRDLAFRIADPPVNGTLTPQLAQHWPLWTYAPDQDWNGTDTFSYSVTDTAGHRAQNTVSVQVKPVNDPPQWILPRTLTLYDGQSVDLRDWVHDPDVYDDAPDELTFFNENGVEIGPELTIGANFDPTTLVVADRAGESVAAPAALDYEIVSEDALVIPLSRGWNAVSLPVEVSASVLQSNVFDAFVHAIWVWEAGCYKKADKPDGLSPGRGFWIFRGEDDPETLTFAGDALGYADPRIPVRSGWNFVGGIGGRSYGRFPADAGPAWGWNPLRQFYQAAEDGMIGRGQAYWYWTDEGEDQNLTLPLDEN